MRYTVAVNYTTDEEAGTVYGVALRLKREGYFQSFNMHNEDGVALLFCADPESADTVVNTYNDLATEKGMRGIFAQID